MTAKIASKRVGYTVDYEIEGTVAEIDDAIKAIHGQYPTPGYGTWFNWPPGRVFTSGAKAGQPNPYQAATDLGDGRWIARGNRSTNCD